MHRADPGAGEHRVGGLGNHGQIDRDGVALLDAVCLQHIGKAAHFIVQLPIGDTFGLLGIVTFPDDGDLVGARGQMAVDAVE